VLVALYAAGRSTFEARKPALAVALAATAIGYGLSCLVAPSSSRHIHDVLYSLRHDINPELLRAGVFNQVGTGNDPQVVYFDHRASDTELDNVFIREVNAANEERVYVARKAVFKRDADTKWVALLDGSAQIFKRDTREMRTFAFDQLVWPGSRSGDIIQQRKKIYSDEIGTLEFLSLYGRTQDDPHWARRWAQEATKRFGIPALTLIHTLLGLELLALLGVTTDRRRQPVVLICALLFTIHAAMVMGSEQIWRFDPALAWGIVAMMLAELALALGLMLRRWRGSGTGGPALRAGAVAAATMLRPEPFPAVRGLPVSGR
jgi:lipopolysaccharide export LptBFGC system permease protein LptF